MPKPGDFGKGRGRFGNFGSGRQIKKLPNDSGTINDISTIYGDFRGGFDSRQLRDGTPANASISAIDIDINGRGRLVKAAGTSLVESLAHPVQQMVMHPSYDGWSEIVVFGSPWMGVKGAGNTQWTNLGIRANRGPVRFGLYGDQLVFSDGSTKVWIRKSGEAPTESTSIPVANAYATFAARLFAGGVSIDGKYEPMGMGWSGTSGDPQDFTGPGANFELLIDDPQASDKIVALRTMGLGLMAILCRHSVWLGKFTGLEERPADFEPRVVGGGIRDEATAKSTPVGVIYLSDDGVRVFDGNTSTVISEKINGEILPLSADRYSASFDPNRNRYSLHTPTETWVFDLTHARWTKLSLVASAGLLFSTQIEGVTWEDLINTTWEQLNDTTWQDMERHEEDDADLYYIKDQRLEKLDSTSSQYFGIAQQPTWATPQTRGFTLANLVQTKAILVEYVGGGNITISLPDINSRFTAVEPGITLDTTNEPTEKWLPLTFTGLTTGVKIQLDSGNLEIVQIQLITQTVSPKVNGPTIVVTPPPGPQPTDAMVSPRIVYINGYDSGAHESIDRDWEPHGGSPTTWQYVPTGGANGKGYVKSKLGINTFLGQYSQLATFSLQNYGGGTYTNVNMGTFETHVYTGGIQVRFNLFGQVLPQPINCMALMATIAFGGTVQLVLRILQDLTVSVCTVNAGIITPLVNSIIKVPASGWFALDLSGGISKHGNDQSGFTIVKLYTESDHQGTRIIKLVGAKTRSNTSTDCITGWRWGTEVLSNNSLGVADIGVDDVTVYTGDGTRYKFVGDLFHDISLPIADGDNIQSTITFDGRLYIVTGSQGTVTVGAVNTHGNAERYKNLAGINSSLDYRVGEQVNGDEIIGDISPFTGDFLTDGGIFVVPPPPPHPDTVVRNTLHNYGYDVYRLAPIRADAIAFAGVFPFALTTNRQYRLRLLGGPQWNWTEEHTNQADHATISDVVRDYNFIGKFLLKYPDGALQSGAISVAPFVDDHWRAIPAYRRDPWSFIDKDHVGNAFTRQSLATLQAGMGGAKERLDVIREIFASIDPTFYEDWVQFDLGLFGLAFAYYVELPVEEIEVIPTMVAKLIEDITSLPAIGHVAVRNASEVWKEVIATSIVTWGDGSPPEPLDISLRLDPADSTIWPTLQHDYARPGTFHPTLTLTTATGKVATSSLTVVIPNKLPTANFSYVGVGRVLTFTDLSVDPDTGGWIASWAWTFGDGGTSTGRNPTHTYAADGTYNVTLQVTDVDGGVSPLLTVSVVVPVVASAAGCPFTGDPVVNQPWVMGDDFKGGNPPLPAYVNTEAFKQYYWGIIYREWYGNNYSNDDTGIEFELDTTKQRNGHPTLRMSFGKNPLPPARSRAVGAGWGGDMTDDDPVTEHYYEAPPWGTNSIAVRLRAFWESGVMSDPTIAAGDLFQGLELFSFSGRAVFFGVYVRAGHIYLDTEMLTAPTGGTRGSYVDNSYDLGLETEFFADRADESAGEIGLHYIGNPVAHTASFKVWIGNMCETVGTAPRLDFSIPAFLYADPPFFGADYELTVDSQSFYNWLFWPDADPNKDLWHVDAKTARLQDNADPFGYVAGAGGGGSTRTHFSLDHFPSAHFGDSHFT